jgi:hypothetical protein
LDFYKDDAIVFFGWVGICAKQCHYGREKKSAGEEKKVYTSLYLFIYASDFNILKSLTQLGKWATQKYIIKKHILSVLLLRSPQKMPIVWEI